MWIVSPSATSSCIFVVFVGIWSFCNSIIPRSGCRRLAKSIHSEVENHAGTVILQVALMLMIERFVKNFFLTPVWRSHVGCPPGAVTGHMSVSTAQTHDDRSYNGWRYNGPPRQARGASANTRQAGAKPRQTATCSIAVTGSDARARRRLG